MNGTTLKALRLALGFSQQEAANIIGGVQLRTWQYWEDANRTIPVDVIETLRDLVSFKAFLIRKAASELNNLIQEHGTPESVGVTYYASLDAWMTQDGALPIQWRPHCMAMAALAETYEFVSLIRFDAIQYQQWLADRADSSTMRAQWAASQ